MIIKQNIRSVCILGICAMACLHANGWGFYAHRLINYQAVFLLPPEMMVLYKPNINFLAEHAVDADKRRYIVEAEASRHYIDLDRYGNFPFDSLPKVWDSAVAKFGEDTLTAHGIVPWHVQAMMSRLTKAFADRNQQQILKLSADIGHYISDAHVPLHACSNYNGQQTNQQGIHAFWESRIPELLAETEFDLWLGTSAYIDKPGTFIWNIVLQSAAAADTVLQMEASLSNKISPDQKFAFEERLGKISRQYSSYFSRQYNNALQGMVERRLRQSMFAVASYWYTAWVNAGKPNLQNLNNTEPTATETADYEALNKAWQSGKMLGREH